MRRKNLLTALLGELVYLLPLLPRVGSWARFGLDRPQKPRVLEQATSRHKSSSLSELDSHDGSAPD